MAAALDRSRRAAELREARRFTLALFTELDESQCIGPELEIVNPPLWEVGHVAWFHERWILRRLAGRAPLRDGVDELYDSIEVHHPERWHLLFPNRSETVAYVAAVGAGVEDVLERGDVDPSALAYFTSLCLFHEDMHVEAMLYTRQTLGCPAPSFLPVPRAYASTGDAQPGGDVELPGGVFELGATRDEPFVFDNEKWAHPVELAPFRIARHAVTQREFADFVEAGGYEQRALWSEAGWRWRTAEGVEHPVYWRRESDGSWSRRRFDAWVPLEDTLPVCHVNYFEAEAFSRHAGRRLPTEAEWEAAAAFDGSSTSAGKRRFPWGDAEPDAQRANLDLCEAGPQPVDAFAAGDSYHGCRQLTGNVWEWTSTDFLPYPGFSRDPYAEYSEPWFGTRKVLRGGAWATRGRMLRNTVRNFFTPDRRDIWCGFRTCAR